MADKKEEKVGLEGAIKWIVVLLALIFIMFKVWPTVEKSATRGHTDSVRPQSSTQGMEAQTLPIFAKKGEWSPEQPVRNGMGYAPNDSLVALIPFYARTGNGLFLFQPQFEDDGAGGKRVMVRCYRIEGTREIEVAGITGYTVQFKLPDSIPDNVVRDIGTRPVAYEVKAVPRQR